MTIDDFIYQVDKICREDLYRKALVSERDYITQFNSLIRYPNGINSSVNNKDPLLPKSIMENEKFLPFLLIKILFW